MMSGEKCVVAFFYAIFTMLYQGHTDRRMTHESNKNQKEKNNNKKTSKMTATRIQDLLELFKLQESI